MPQPASYVQPIHFEDFDGPQFERLVFAYHWRSENWRSLEWYGQTGSDLGRDIWGVRENETKDGESVCIQCVNRSRLTFAKAEKDTAKVLKADKGQSRHWSGGPVELASRGIGAESSSLNIEYSMVRLQGTPWQG